VSRAPGIPHQLVIQNLQIAFAKYLELNPIGVIVPGTGAIFSDYDAVIPDLAFVRNERWDEVVTGEKFTGALDLVVEVTSPGAENRRRDLLVKRQLYGKYGMREYWVVDCDTRQVEVYRLQGQRLESAGTFKNSDEFATALLPGLKLAANNIFHF
jgi:Uma2 family endonuclease